VGADSGDDGGVVAIEEPPDLLVAEGELRMMSEAPPELAARPCDRLRPAAAADLRPRNAARSAHVVDELEEIAIGERGGDLLVIDVNYFCRSATTRIAGRRQVVPSFREPSFPS
jgi:hypothetical protein